MWNKAVSRRRWSAFALFLTLSGCTAVSDCKYEFGQKIRTSQAWHEFDDCHDQSFTGDYSSGWKAGYYDVATGGRGCPPVVAPSKYWKPPVFCEFDPARRDDWYRGFLDGAACAQCQPDHHYLQTYLPGPALCPATTACCPTIIDGAATDSMQQNDGAGISGGLEFQSETMQSDSQVPQAPETPVDVAPVPAENQPATAPTPGQPTPAEDYEKDPAEPIQTTDPQGSTSLLRQLIQQSQKLEASRSNTSRVQQLVSSTQHPAGDDGF